MYVPCSPVFDKAPLYVLRPKQSSLISSKNVICVYMLKVATNLSFMIQIWTAILHSYGIYEMFPIYVNSVISYITKTCLYYFDPLKPHIYIVKLGFTGVYIIFLISAQNIDSGYSLEPPRRGGSNEYPQSMFWAEIRKISEFLSEIFHFLMVKFSVYLNRRVFVMSVSNGLYGLANWYAGVERPYHIPANSCLQGIYFQMFLSNTD